MPVEALKSLMAMRDGIRDSLKADPQLQTLATLDRTIAEIEGFTPKPEKPAGAGVTEEAPGEIWPKGMTSSGYEHMDAPKGAKKYDPSPAVQGALPAVVDLRSQMPPIEDQGHIGTCTANAVAGAYEHWLHRATGSAADVSRLFIFYNARMKGGKQDLTDETGKPKGGSKIQYAMDCLAELGVCNEKVWPYEENLACTKPDAGAYQAAYDHRIKGKMKVPLEAQAWKQALAEGMPIVFCVNIYKDFQPCAKTGGLVPMPSPQEIASTPANPHAMLVVGYSDHEGVFIVRNSWNTWFGDKGYCYMPQEYLLNPKLNANDCWVLEPSQRLAPPHDTWSDDKVVVTNGGRGVNVPIRRYRPEDYDGIEDPFRSIRNPYVDERAPAYERYLDFVRRGAFGEMDRFDTGGFMRSLYGPNFVWDGAARGGFGPGLYGLLGGLGAVGLGGLLVGSIVSNANGASATVATGVNPDGVDDDGPDDGPQDDVDDADDDEDWDDGSGDGEDEPEDDDESDDEDDDDDGDSDDDDDDSDDADDDADDDVDGDDDSEGDDDSDDADGDDEDWDDGSGDGEDGSEDEDDSDDADDENGDDDASDDDDGEGEDDSDGDDDDGDDASGDEDASDDDDAEGEDDDGDDSDDGGDDDGGDDGGDDD